MSAPALFGLVLAGGASTRMHRDKAVLEYQGVPQLQRAFELLSRFCLATFVSVRPQQRDEPARAAYPQIVDRQPGCGPIAGISAALLAHPQAAWLVLACDLPFVTDHTLRQLIACRATQKMATAYRSSHDGLPEPLCAIWEPAARGPMLAYIASGKQCPRKLLIGSDTALLDLAEPRALDNINTPQEFSAAATTLQASGTARPAPPGSTKSVRVEYYAILREQAGRSDETLDTNATTPAQLYDELRQRHSLRLSPAQLKVALNSRFSDWHTPLQHGDTVVFIPPVAGG